MNVKKLYCELVARGMPFIVWRGADYSVPLDPKANAGMMNAVWPDGYESPLMHLAEHVPGDDAVFKNHLTIWALDWFVSAVDDECFLEHWNGPTRPTGNTEPGWDLQYMRNGDDSTGYDGFGPTILEAIEAATRHLEPTND